LQSSTIYKSTARANMTFATSHVLGGCLLPKSIRQLWTKVVV